MSFSVGVLYSVQEFLQFAQGNVLSVEEFVRQTRFVLVHPTEVLQAAQDCGWIKLTIDGHIVVTERGCGIIEPPAPELKLRLQIEDLISAYRPTWAARIRYGRKETIYYMPAEVEQCFSESGLLDPWTDELVRWWKLAATAARI